LESQEKNFVVFDKIDKSYDGEVLVVKNLNLKYSKRRVCNNARAFRVWQNHNSNDACRI